MTTYFDRCVDPDWRIANASRALDVAGIHHVRQIHARIGRLVVRDRPLGDLQSRQATLLRSLERAGTWKSCFFFE